MYYYFPLFYFSLPDRRTIPFSTQYSEKLDDTLPIPGLAPFPLTRDRLRGFPNFHFPFSLVRLMSCNFLSLSLSDKADPPEEGRMEKEDRGGRKSGDLI